MELRSKSTALLCGWLCIGCDEPFDRQDEAPAPSGGPSVSPRTPEAGLPEDARDAQMPELSDASVRTLSFGINPSPSDEFDAGYADAELLADAEVSSLGSRAVSFSVRWDELARVGPGGELDSSTLGAWQRRLEHFARAGAQVSFSFDVVERMELASPPVGADFGDPARLAAAKLAIDELYASLGASLAVFALGKDVDRYLERLEADDRATFARFLNDTLGYAVDHPARPAGVEVGVLASLEGWSNPSSELSELVERVDQPLLSFYPLDDEFRALPVDQAIGRLDGALAALRGSRVRSFALHEVAYPSSTDAGSSPSAQAEFYERLVDRLASVEQQVSFVAVRSLHDPEPTVCVPETAAFGQQPGGTLEAWLCSVGVKSRGAIAKPAFMSVQRGLARFYGS